MSDQFVFLEVKLEQLLWYLNYKMYFLTLTMNMQKHRMCMFEVLSVCLVFSLFKCSSIVCSSGKSVFCLSVCLYVYHFVCLSVLLAPTCLVLMGCEKHAQIAGRKKISPFLDGSGKKEVQIKHLKIFILRL